MRARFLLGLATTLLLGSAVAAPMRADKVMFQGTHGIFFTNGTQGSELTVTDTGLATVNEAAMGGSQLNTLRLGSDFAEFDLKTSPSRPSQVQYVQLDNVRINPQLQGGVFAPIWSAVQPPPTASPTPLALTQNTLPLAGTFKICPGTGCAPGIVQQLPARTPDTASGALAGTGIGGSFQRSATFGMFLFQGNPWTIHTTSVQYQTVSTTLLGAKVLGTETLTAMGYLKGKNGTTTGSTLPTSGTVQLVTATQVTSDTDITPSGYISRLTIHFQPEPGRLLLLGAGALVTALLGWRRAARR